MWRFSSYAHYGHNAISAVLVQELEIETVHSFSELQLKDESTKSDEEAKESG